MTRYVFTRLVPSQSEGGDDVVVPDFSSARVEFVSELPEPSETTLGVIYLVVDEEAENTTLAFTKFDGIEYSWVSIHTGEKGDKGDQGIQGETGERGPAGVESITVSVDGLSGTPRAVATLVNGDMSISFYGLKGMQGDPGTSHARQQVVTTLPTAGADTTDIVYLKQIGSTDEYERWITQYDGTNYSWVQIGTTEMTMDD